MYELGVIARTRVSLTYVASAALETLAAETGETVILSRADMDTLEVVVVDSRTRTHALGVGRLTVGVRSYRQDRKQRHSWRLWRQ